MVMNPPFSTRRETSVYPGRKNQLWKLLRIKISDNSFTEQACRNFFPETCWTKPKQNTINEGQDSSRSCFVSVKCCFYVVKRILVETFAQLLSI